MSRNPKEDIRGQLSDIQLRLFRKPDAPKKEPLKSQENILRTDPNAAKTSNSRSTSIATATPTLGPDTKGNDMNFVVGLSENLLAECRRLTAESRKYKSRAKAAAEELQDVKNQMLRLKASYESLSSKELALKDKNWELESAVTTLQEQNNTLTKSNAKLTQENQDESEKLEAIQKEYDELKVKNSQATQELLNLKLAFKTERKELNNRIHALNDENDELHKKLKSFEPSSQEVTKQAIPVSLPEDAVDVSLESILDNSFKLPTVSLREDLDANLRAESLSANLNYAHQVISKLRSSFLKQLEESKALKQASPTAKLTTNNSSEHPFESITPSNRKSKLIVVDEDSAEPNEWDEFMAGINETSPSKPTKLERPASSNFTENVPQLDSDSESDVNEKSSLQRESEMKNYADSKGLVLLDKERYDELCSSDIRSVSQKALIEEADTRGLKTLSREEYNELIDETEMRKKLRLRGLVTIPEVEHEKLMKDQRSFMEPSLEYLEAKAASHKYVMVPEDANNKLHEDLARLQNPELSHLESCAAKLNHTLIPEADYKSLKSTVATLTQKTTKPTEEEVRKYAQKLNFKIIKTEDYSKLIHPSKEMIQEAAHKIGFAILPMKDHELFMNPTEPFIRQRAAELNLETIEKTSLDELKNIQGNPSISFLESHANKKDHKLLTLRDYEAMKSELNFPTVDALLTKASSLDHVLILKQDHEKLLLDANSPSLSHIKHHADKHGLVNLLKQEYSSLFKKANDPAAVEIEQFAKQKGLVVMSLQEHSNLNEKLDKPTVSYLRDKAAASGHKLVEAKAYQEIENLANNPSIKHIKEKANQQNLQVVPVDELKSLEKLANEPPRSHLEEKCTKLGLSVLDTKELERINMLANDPTLNHLQEKLQKFEHESLATKDIKELKDAAASPSIEVIKRVTGELGQIVITTEDYAKLSEDSTKLEAVLLELSSKSENLRAKSEEVDNLQNSNSELRALNDKLTEDISGLDSQIEKLNGRLLNPSQTFVLEASKKLGYEMVEIDELKDMKEEISNPTLQSLEAKAAALDHVIISTTTFDELSAIQKTPSIDFLQEKAQEKGFSVIDTEKYSITKRNAETPDVQHLQKHATKLGYDLVEREKLASLTKLQDSIGKIDFVSELADAMGHVLVPNKDHETLTRKVTSPTLQEVRDYAKVHQLMILAESEYSKLRKSVESPELEFIKLHADRFDKALVDKTQLKELENLAHHPPLERVLTSLTTYNYLGISTEDLEALKLTNEKPSEEFLRTKASKLGLELLPTTDLTALKKLAHNPDIEHLLKLSKSQGYVHVDSETYQQLNALANDPPKEHIDEKLKSMDHASLSLDELKSLRSPSLDQLKEHLKKYDYATVEKSAYQKLLERVHSPDVTQLSAAAEKTGHTLIERTELERLHEELNNPSRKQLEVACAKLNLVAVDDSELQGLKEQLRSPNLDKVVKDARRLGLEALPVEEYEKLVEKVRNPTQEQLMVAAKQINYTVVPLTLHEELVQKATEPSMTQLQSMGEKQGYSVINNDHYQQLKRIAESPTTEELTQKAEVLGCKVIEGIAYESLANPSRLSLEARAKKFDCVLVDSDEYRTLKLTSSNPSSSFLTAQAEKNDFKLVDQTKYEEMVKTLDTPSEEFIREKGRSMDLKVMTRDEFLALETLAKNPSIEHIKSGAESHNHLLISKNDHEKLAARANKSIEELAKESNMTVLSLGTYAKLRDEVEKPTLSLLVEKLESLGYMAITLQEHEELNKKANKLLEERTSEAGLQLIQPDTLTKLKEDNSVSAAKLTEQKETIEGLNDDIANYKSLLLSSEESLTIERERTEANAIKLAQLQSEAKNLTKSIENPSELYLADKAESYNLCLINKKECDELREKAGKSIDQLSSELGLIAIGNEEYESLKRKVSDPTSEELEKHATNMGYELVQTKEWTELVKNHDDPPLSYLSEKAVASGKVVIDSVEYSELVEAKNEPLERRAASLNKTLLDSAEYDQLLKTANEPSLDVVSLMAEKHGHSIIPIDLLNDIRSIAEEPLESRAKKSGCLLIPEKQYSALTNSLEHPEVTYLKKKASELDFELMSVTELEDMRKRLEQPSIDELKKHAETHSMNMIDVGELLSLKASADEPIESKAEKVGAIVLPHTEYSSLREKAEKTLEQHAKEKNMRLLSAEEFNELKERGERPSMDFIGPYISALGFSMLPRKELDTLRSRADESTETKAARDGKRVVDSLDYEQMVAKAESPDLDHLSAKANPLGYTLVDNKELDHLRSSESETLEEKAERCKKVVLDEDSHKELLEPSVAKLTEHASKNGLSIITTTELLQLKQIAEEGLDVQAAKQGKVIVPAEEFDELVVSKRSLEQEIENPSLDLIINNASRHGYVAIEQEALDELKSRANESVEIKAERANKILLNAAEYDDLLIKANKPTIEEIKRNASMNGLIAVPEHDYDTLLAECNEPLEAKATAKGMALVPSKELDELRSIEREPHHSFLQEKSSLLGLAMIPTAELGSLKERASNPTHSEIEEMASKRDLAVVPTDQLQALRNLIDDPSINYIKDKAAVHGMSVIESHLLFNLRDQLENPSIDFLSQGALGHGYVTIPEEELESLKDALNNPGRTVLDAKAAELGCVIITRDDVEAMQAKIDKPSLSYLKEKSSASGHAMVSEENLRNLEEAANRTIEEKAKEAGFVALTGSEYETLLSRSSDLEHLSKLVDNSDELKDILEKRGYSVITAEEAKEVNVERIMKTAKENGYIVVHEDDPTSADIAHLSSWLESKSAGSWSTKSQDSTESFADAETSFVLSEEELQRSAEALGYTLVKANEAIKSETPRSMAPITRRGSSLSLDTIEETLDEEDLKRIAKQRDFLLVPRSSYIALNVEQEPDVENVTVIPTTYFKKLTSNKADNINNVGDDVFEKHATERGYMRTPDVSTPPPTMGAIDELSTVAHPSPDVFTPPATSRFSDKQRRYSPALSTSHSMRSNLSLQSMPRSINASLQTADIFSMATNVSLTDTSMIPAITQVVIGEYLFKYYRRLGGLSAISETRHERYFWVHPYTLTLYWSTSNPVLGNPADVKTRAAAIVGVESVEDNNPLPTGLYHKSIIVRSQDRSIKITCPTRKRHNIWYNALRYLIHRNMNELSFDTEDTEDKDGPATPPASGPLFETEDRHAFPRSSLTSSAQLGRSPSSKKLSRHFSTLRRTK